MSIDEKCCKCNAEMKPGNLDENGICSTCKKLGIGKKKKKENVEVEKRAEENKKFVEKLIEDAMVRYGILECCECGKFFFRRSPAQKRCGDCKGDK